GQAGVRQGDQARTGHRWCLRGRIGYYLSDGVRHAGGGRHRSLTHASLGYPWTMNAGHTWPSTSVHSAAYEYAPTGGADERMDSGHQRSFHTAACTPPLCLWWGVGSDRTVGARPRTCVVSP